MINWQWLTIVQQDWRSFGLKVAKGTYYDPKKPEGTVAWLTEGGSIKFALIGTLFKPSSIEPILIKFEHIQSTMPLHIAEKRFTSKWGDLG